MPTYEAKEWTRLWYDEATDTQTPRVMLIGDSITAGYTVPVNKHLDNVLRADSIAGSKALDHPVYNEEIDLFSRQFGFDYQLIHFNNGLHGWHLTTEEYGRLYEEKVVWLMKRYPSAKLVLATSTPLRVGGGDSALKDQNALVLERNEKVWQVAKKYDLPVDDLYAAMVDHPEWQGADGTHFNENGTDAQGSLIAAFIRAQLDL